jgi:hypothetical protein
MIARSVIATLPFSSVRHDTFVHIRFLPRKRLWSISLDPTISFERYDDICICVERLHSICYCVCIRDDLTVLRPSWRMRVPPSQWPCLLYKMIHQYACSFIYISVRICFFTQRGACKDWKRLSHLHSWVFWVDLDCGLLESSHVLVSALDISSKFENFWPCINVLALYYSPIHPSPHPVPSYPSTPSLSHPYSVCLLGKSSLPLFTSFLWICLVVCHGCDKMKFYRY